MTPLARSSERKKKIFLFCFTIAKLTNLSAQKRQVKDFQIFCAQHTKCSVPEKSGVIELKFGNRAYYVIYFVCSICVIAKHMCHIIHISHWNFELFSSSNHISPLLNRPQGCQGCQKNRKDLRFYT